MVIIRDANELLTTHSHDLFLRSCSSYQRQSVLLATCSLASRPSCTTTGGDKPRAERDLSRASRKGRETVFSRDPVVFSGKRPPLPIFAPVMPIMSAGFRCNLALWRCVPRRSRKKATPILRTGPYVMARILTALESSCIVLPCAVLHLLVGVLTNPVCDFHMPFSSTCTLSSCREGFVVTGSEHLHLMLGSK